MIRTVLCAAEMSRERDGVSQLPSDIRHEKMRVNCPLPVRMASATFATSLLWEGT